MIPNAIITHTMHIHFLFILLFLLYCNLYIAIIRNFSSKINTGTVMQMKGMNYLWSKSYDKSMTFPLGII